MLIAIYFHNEDAYLIACGSLRKFTVIDNKKIYYLYYDNSVGITINRII